MDDQWDCDRDSISILNNINNDRQRHKPKWCKHVSVLFIE